MDPKQIGGQQSLKRITDGQQSGAPRRMHRATGLSWRTVVVSAIVVATIYLLAVQPWRLRCVDGQEYMLLSFRNVTAEASDGQVVDATIITFAEIDSDVGDEATKATRKGSRVGTVRVLTRALTRDEGLPEGSFVIDPPINIEGRSWSTVRWHPTKEVAAPHPTLGQ